MGGTLANVVPDYAQIQFDVRYLHTQDRLALEERWRQMMQQQRVQGVALSLEVPTDSGEPMILTPEALKLAQQAQEIASVGLQELYNKNCRSSKFLHQTPAEKRSFPYLVSIC